MEFVGGPYDGQPLSGTPAAAVTAAAEPEWVCFRAAGGSGWAHYQREAVWLRYRYTGACERVHGDAGGRLDPEVYAGDELHPGVAEIVYQGATEGVRRPRRWPFGGRRRG